MRNTRSTAIRIPRPALVLLLLMGLAAAACDSGSEQASMPEWVESVYPEAGTTVAVPDAVEVDHTVQGIDEDVRLVIDDVDVATYASFEAGKVRYESGEGPVELGGRQHTAEVQRVELPHEGTDFRVIDSFRWQFHAG
ncbi:MAG: hypothetical protein ACLFWM_13500 [Actinomycetota bacterium]